MFTFFARAVLVNNEPGTFSRIKGGLKGCPLSPISFILTADILSRSLGLAAHGVWPHQWDWGLGSWEVTSLQYADDTLIFSGTTEKEIRCVSLCLIGFSMASGLQINFAKTKSFYLGNDDNKANEIARKVGCEMGNFPLNYLGILISDKALPWSTWDTLIAKIRKKLDGF